MQGFRYKAFVSYSHRDRTWGQWLFKSIEGYSIPKHLIGKSTREGKIPRHLRPLFRDREELPATDNLSMEIQKALSASEYLIVLCSKQSAKSLWVSREIEEFITCRNRKNILCLILDGEPNAALSGMDISEECFPEPLRVDTGSSSAFEPIAADVREGRDGKRLALLKIISGMIGVGLDEVIRRDLQKKYRHVTAITGLSLLGVLIMGFLTLMAIEGRQEAEQRRTEAEGLIEFMLTDLREKLEPVGRLDVLDTVGEKAVNYYKAQNPQNMSDDSLGRKARALHLLGEIDHLQDDLIGAQQKFEQTAATTAKLLKKDPTNPQRIFDHSQSVYWVAYMHWLQGKYDAAEMGWNDYKKLAEQLVALEPENEDWQLELSYAHSNLGTLYLQSLGRPADALKNFALALSELQKRANRTPNNSRALRDLADAHAWVSDAALYAGEFKTAFDHRNQEQVIYLYLLKQQPNNIQTRRDIISTWSALAELNLRTGNLLTAEQLARKAWRNGRDLLDHDPENMEWRQQAAFIGMRKTKILLAAGKTAEAQESLAVTKNISREIEIDTVKRRVEIHYQSRILQAQILKAQGDLQHATHLLQNLRQDMKADQIRDGKNPLFNEIWNLTQPEN